MGTLVQEILSIRGVNPSQLVPYKEEVLNFPALTDATEALTYTYFMDSTISTGILYDVDMDGVAAGGMLYDFLKRRRGHNMQLHTFMNTGKKHGITPEVIEWVREKRIQYLFVVDAGSGDSEAHVQLSKMGVHVVILDHHPYTPQPELPPNVWLVNPIHNSELPLLSGAGVTYRFIELIARKFQMQVEDYEVLVGISVISDVCSMTDRENRYYVTQLYRNYARIPLIKVLADEFFTGSLNSLFGYKIIPFFNALIRIGQGNLAIELINNMFNLGKSKRAPSLQKIAIEQQKQMQAELMQVSKLIEKPNVVLLLRNVRPELSTLNGLVANKLREMYKKEALVLYIDTEPTLTYTGSYRGHRGSIQDFLSIGVDARGHAQACGVKFTKEQLQQYANQFTPNQQQTQRIADFDVQLDSMDTGDLMAIAQFNEMTGKDLEPIVLNVRGGFRSITQTIQEKNRVLLFCNQLTIVQFANRQYSDDYIVFTPSLSKFERQGFQMIRM